jgi:2-iminoacetate synthase ThiH
VPVISFEEWNCPICGEKEKLLLPIGCNKCGHMLLDEKIHREAKKQEIRHKHSQAEYKAWFQKIRKG